MKKILFDPVVGETNRYVDILVDGLSNIGFHIFSSKQVFSSIRLLISIKVFHFNWIENASGLALMSQFIKIFLLKFFGKKIVWTMHNKVPHRGNRFNFTFVKCMLYFSHKVVVHSKVSIEVAMSYFSNSLFSIDSSKFTYIPHPNYIGIGKSLEISNPAIGEGMNIGEGNLKLVFIGAIKPYKNLELLIESVKPFCKDVELLIAGSCLDSLYFESLVRLSEGHGNIVLNNKFLKDCEMISLIRSADLVVTPYDLLSSLNSGSCILSFSNGRSVICPLIGTIQEIENKEVVYSYSYKNSKDHLSMLVGIISDAIAKKKLDSKVFDKWGEVLYDEVKNYNDPVIVSKQFGQIYDILMGKLK